MKIVVLDGFTVNPGDLEWTRFGKLGELVVYDRTPPEETVNRSADAEVVLTNKTVLSRAVIERLHRLKYIGVLATGYNNVDLEAARARGVPVANIPEYSTQSVAEMVFAHILNIVRRVADHSAGVHAGKWSRSKDFCYRDFPQTELNGQTLGVVGLGRIGKAVAHIGSAFGMRVVAMNRTPPANPPAYVELVDLDRLCAQSDFITLHCPLTEANHNFVDARMLAKMKTGAFLVNTSRGPLIDEAALAAALETGAIAGAALDVLSVEPPPADNPLIGARNCHISPHIAWATLAARRRLMDLAFDNLEAFYKGESVNVVNGV